MIVIRFQRDGDRPTEMKQMNFYDTGAAVLFSLAASLCKHDEISHIEIIEDGLICFAWDRAIGVFALPSSEVMRRLSDMRIINPL